MIKALVLILQGWSVERTQASLPVTRAEDIVNDTIVPLGAGPCSNRLARDAIASSRSQTKLTRKVRQGHTVTTSRLHINRTNPALFGLHKPGVGFQPRQQNAASGQPADLGSQNPVLSIKAPILEALNFRNRRGLKNIPEAQTPSPSKTLLNLNAESPEPRLLGFTVGFIRV